MKRACGILFFILFFSNSLLVLADNQINIGDVDNSDVQIEQGNQGGVEKAGNNQIKAEDIRESQVKLKQGNEGVTEKKPSSSLGKDVSKAMIAGAVTFIFGLLFWWFKRKMGDTREG